VLPLPGLGEFGFLPPSFLSFVRKGKGNNNIFQRDNYKNFLYFDLNFTFLL
jgi:hypothetical protein